MNKVKYLASGRSRKFDGKKYHETGSFLSKRKAKSRARNWRENGWQVRIAKLKSQKYPYQIFVRRP